MNAPFIFLLMIFFHILDDYVLQGWLASAKQKDWWKKNAPEKLYECDWACALIMHSLSWSFMIMLPIAIAQGFCINNSFIYYFMWNAGMHAWVDHQKANRKTINLWLDQVLHIAQIVATFLMMV